MTYITIRITENTKDRIVALKKHPRETYDEVLNRVVPDEEY